MDSVHAFWNATSAFWGHLAQVRFGALGIAVLLVLANLLLRATAWRSILAAAHPGTRVRWRSVTAAYLSGVGTNAIVPARAGDVMKVYMAHRSIPGSAYTTIASSLLAETALDVVIGPALLLAAYSTGRVPHLPALGRLAAFEWSFFAAHLRWFALALAVILILIGVFFGYLERRVTAFWTRVSLGLAILRMPQRYLRRVASLQLLGWVCRAAAMYWFLTAFRISAGVVDATLALSAQSAATLLPLTPGGVGTQQALLGYMFRSAAPASTVLAFSVGMQVAVTLTNVVAGGAALSLTFRRLPWRAHAEAKPPPGTAPARRRRWPRKSDPERDPDPAR
jgi:uncharacterized protein (TIRG00374 family)